METVRRSASGKPVRYRVRRNDWSIVRPPELGAWTPTLPVSVVIPAHGGQATLDLTLAALARQTYPGSLLEVVVVDDGSEAPLRLPAVRPESCRLVRIPSDSGGWGPAYARHAGAEAASGEIIHWLDADMVTYPEHVEAQVRWQHVLPEAVTIGYKRFVDASLPTPKEVLTHADENRMDELFPMAESSPHEWVERFIRRRGGLRRGRFVYHVHVGATAALRRELYDAAGGMDVSLQLGEDTELGYRLEQVGAVFIPEPRAKSWHLGRSSMIRDGAALRRHNRPFLEHRMPLYPGWREDPGRQWAVPAVVAVVEVGGHPAAVVENCVSRLLGSYDDLHVDLVGPWDRLDSARRTILDDSDLDLRIIRAGIGSDRRVSLAAEPPATVSPSPLRLDVPADCAVGVRTVSRLIDRIEKGDLGLIEVDVPGGDSVLRMWRTSAVNRALRVMEPGENLRAVVDEVWGTLAIEGSDIGLSPAPVAASAERDPVRWPRFETDDDIRALEQRADELSRKVAQLRTPWGWARDLGGRVIRRLRRHAR